MLKEAFALADKEGYRFGGVKKKAGNQRKKGPQNHRIDSNTILLPGILHENSKEAADRSELASNSDDEISNEGSTCDMNDSAFYDTNPSDEEQDDVVEASYLGEEWAWDQFEEFDDNGPVPGPEETDHYNSPHGLKPNVRHNFKTILQSILPYSNQRHNFTGALTHTHVSSTFLGVCVYINASSKRAVMWCNHI